MDTPDINVGFSFRSKSTNISQTSKTGDSSSAISDIFHRPVTSYKRIATDEEKFQSDLGDIIERDFFPNLADARGKHFNEDGQAKKLGLNQYLEIHYNENRCCIPNITYKKEFETRFSLQAGIPSQQQNQLLESQNPLALATPSSTLTQNLESREMSNEEILRHADNKPLIVYENTALQGNPFETKTEEPGVRTKLIMVRDPEKGIFKCVEKILPPRRNHSFVSLTPSPKPGAAESPIMTYGQLENTPAKIESSTPKFRGFSIKPVSAREEMAHRLERNATSRAKVTPSPMSRSKLLHDYRRGITPSSPWVSQQVENIRSGRMWRNSSQTPTPNRRAVPIVRLHSDRRKKFTTKPASNAEENANDKDLTDNLLQIPILPKNHNN